MNRVVLVGPLKYYTCGFNAMSDQYFIHRLSLLLENNKFQDFVMERKEKIKDSELFYTLL